MPIKRSRDLREAEDRNDLGQAIKEDGTVSCGYRRALRVSHDRRVGGEEKADPQFGELCVEIPFIFGVLEGKTIRLHPRNRDLCWYQDIDLYFSERGAELWCRQRQSRRKKRTTMQSSKSLLTFYRFFLIGSHLSEDDWRMSALDTPLRDQKYRWDVYDIASGDLFRLL